MRVWIFSLVLVFTIAKGETIYAGRTFPFAERDATEETMAYIKANRETLRAMAKTYAKEYEQQYNSHSPKGVSLPRALKDKEFKANTIYVNPTNIYDLQGVLVYPQGYAFNIFEYIKLPYKIYVVNAERPSEIAWLRDRGALGHTGSKILITQGKYGESVKNIGQDIFFATPRLLERLNVKATPSEVEQVGTNLIVREFGVQDEILP